MPRRLVPPARGVSLAELLVGMVIALMVLGIALQLTLIARERYLRLADKALIDDRGMQALELIGNAIHQAGWITDTPASSPVRRWPEDADAQPSLVGRDNCGSPTMLPTTLGCGGNGVQGSDALLVRFAGRSPATDPSGVSSDNAMRDCGGYGVPERINGESDPRPGRMLVYVSISKNTGNEPVLMCLSLKRGKSDAPAPGVPYSMVRGVETMQLLYTLAPTATAAETTVPARAISKEDWSRVRQVHVAIVVRGDRVSTRLPASNEIALFPDLGAVPNAQAGDLTFVPIDPRRNRARFNATLAVRNPLRCEADAC